MGAVGHRGELESSFSPQRRGAMFPPHGRPVLVESMPGMSQGVLGATGMGRECAAGSPIPVRAGDPVPSRERPTRPRLRSLPG